MEILEQEKTIIIFLIFAVVALLLWIVRIEFRLNRFLFGKNSQNMGESIMSIKRDLSEFREFKTEASKEVQKLKGKASKSIRGVETVRFNPFQGTGSGGNQSFATAFLNELGDGVVISSLYARERTSVYSKPIKNYSSEYELSEEEKQAIQKAKEQI